MCARVPALMSVLVLSTLCLSSSTLAQPPARVKDINTTLTGSTWQWPWTSDFVAMGGIVFFSVSDGIHGTELWRSDGTEGGTQLVRDICPGACASHPMSMIVIGTTLYFSADDGAHGSELWKSDGTGPGTVLVKDANPGLSSSTPTDFFELNGDVFFAAWTEATGRELWKTDGTGAGTFLFKEIASGAQSSQPRPWGRLGAIVFLSAGDADHGVELWTTDGSASGTVLLKDIWPGPNSSLDDGWAALPGYTPFAVAGGLFYFAASDDSSGSELWVSDGTPAGTVRLKDIQTGPESSSPFALVALGTEILFRADDGTHGLELWKSGGTEASTVLVKDIQSGGAGSAPWELTPVGSWVYFRANDGANGSELWKTDGSEANTVLVKDIQPGPANGLSLFGPASFAAIGTTVVFFADDGTHGIEPWRSDGTDGGTFLLADLNPGSGDSQYLLFGPITDRRIVAGGRWWFRAFTDPSGGFEVYLSDGQTVTQLKEINDQASAFELSFLGFPFGANHLADRNGSLFFQASDGLSGSELWKSDGSSAGTEQVADIFPGAGGSGPFEITALGNSVLFNAIGDPAAGSELWISDGTEPGTMLLKDLEPANTSSGGWPWWLTRMGNQVFFSAYDGSTEKLWQSDGSEAGTHPVRDMAPTADAPAELTVLGNLLLFSGGGPDGHELWRTDGTSDGTVQVANIMSGTASSSPDRLTRVGSRVFFSADDGSAGRELWVSDGFSASRIKDIFPGAGSGIALTVDDQAFRFEHWAELEGRLVFPADDGSGTGEELWISDGTDGGTFLLKDVLPGPRASEIRWLTNVGNRVYFVADDGTHGREVWVTDGTPAGTRMLADLTPGMDSSVPEQLFAIGTRLIFSAHTPDGGREPWITDGDAVGTRRLADLAPGALPSSPFSFTLSGPWLYFGATDAEAGFELYSVPRAAVDGGSDFYTVTPCRVADTRISGGPLVAGDPRTFEVAGLCGIPDTAEAVVVNVTVVEPTAGGHLVLYRGATEAPLASTINFAAGQTRANNATLKIGEGALTALAAAGSVHLILDVSGYYQ